MIILMIIKKKIKKLLIIKKKLLIKIKKNQIEGKNKFYLLIYMFFYHFIK